MQNASNVVSEVLASAADSSPSRIEAAPSAALPKLAWLATLDFDQARLKVLHGRAVEARPTFVVEGVWDGPFEDGAFHNGAHLFGSGVRLDGGAVHFVPSAALVDRLVYCRDGGKLLVSNSILALMAATGARLDPDHDYLVDSKAMLDGIDRYDTTFHVLHPTIPCFHQVYHKVLTVRGSDVTLERTIPVREFATFADYDTMLRERLAAIAANASDTARRTPVATFGTLSTGYDSTAVTALIKDLGVRRFFTYVGAWGGSDTKGKPEYETAPIAAALGVETIGIEAPRAPDPEDELLLRAASPLGQQMPLIAMASYVERHAQAAAVFTGFHGDVVWGLNVPASALSASIVRHGTSGLDLTELRLKSGFFNVAVPFLYAASIESIAALSKSPEMAPWTLGTSYDRPISRRIVEGAGVPREQFGFLKGGIMGSDSQPAGAELRKSYFGYLRRNGLPSPWCYARVGLDHYTMRLLGTASRFARRRKWQRSGAKLLEQFRRFNDGYSWYGRRNQRSTLYCWAATELVGKLRERGVGAPVPADGRAPAPRIVVN
jgi:hypothetical protein